MVINFALWNSKQKLIQQNKTHPRSAKEGLLSRELWHLYHKPTSQLPHGISNISPHIPVNNAYTWEAS